MEARREEEALAVGIQVAVVGLADAVPAVPVAAVVRAGRVSSERLIEVAWNASQLRILREHGPVSALVALTLRTYQTRPTRRGAELIRRDDGGRWQPVVDGLAGVEIDYGLAGDLGTEPLCRSWRRVALGHRRDVGAGYAQRVDAG